MGTLAGRGTLEECAWAVGHYINIEEHIVEALMGSEQTREELLHLCKAVYYTRMRIAEIYLKLNGLSIENSIVRNYWCVLKHFLSVQVHLQELSSMLERDGLTELSKEVANLYKETVKLRKLFIDILKKATQQGEGNE